MLVRLVKIQHVPQDGSVDFCQALSVFSSGFHCCHQHVMFFFMHAWTFQVLFRTADSMPSCKHMPPSFLLPGNSSSPFSFFALCNVSTAICANIESDIFLFLFLFVALAISHVLVAARVRNVALTARADCDHCHSCLTVDHFTNLMLRQNNFDAQFVIENMPQK